MENEDLSFGTYGKFGTSSTSHTNGTHSWANLNASQLVFFILMVRSGSIRLR